MSKYNKEQLKCVYENKPYTIKEISLLFKISEDCIYTNIKKYNWKRNENIIKELELKRQQKISNTLLNKSNLEKSNTLQKRINTNKQKYNSEYYHNTNKWKETYWNKSEQERKQITQKQINTNKNKSALEKQEIQNKIQQNKDKEKLSNSLKQVWSNRTQEEKDNIANKISTSLSNKTQEEKDIIINKRKETYKLNRNININNLKLSISKRTQEEKDIIQNKINAKWNSKTKQELQEIINKRKETYKLNNTKNNIANKIKETSNKKYNRDHFSQIHINKSDLDILNNKDKLKQYILNIPYNLRTREYVADQLNINYSHLNHILNNFNFEEQLFNNTKSKYELEILNFLRTFYNGTIIRNTRKVIPPLELDFYIPNKSIAIEFNGNYVHSNLKLQNKNYHYNKSKLCEEKGIRLIHIFEYEWNNYRQRPILENIIKNALGYNSNKIYARKLSIEIRESKTMKEFFNTNNIQGFRGGKFAICLVDKQTKECYMSYIIGKAFFGNGKYEYEVIRGATKLGYTVIGGASKIWNYFIKNYNPSSCVYYIDYNYFNGNSLKNLPNMKFIKTQPGFKNYYVQTKEIKNRNPLNHKQIVEGYKNGTILQIWNAGTKVYVWTKE